MVAVEVGFGPWVNVADGLGVAEAIIVGGIDVEVMVGSGAVGI
jgi:hypothetical protein